MAGFGMQLWGIVQDLSQLDRIYDKGWQTFISNSGVLQYFGSRDQMTAEYFSKLCGVTTIRIFNLSYAISQTVGDFFSSGSSSSWGGGSSSSSSNTSSGSNTSKGDTRTVSANESQRSLVYPDELMVLAKDRQIVLVENFNPIRARKLQWYTEPDLKALGHALVAAPVAAGAPVTPLLAGQRPAPMPIDSTPLRSAPSAELPSLPALQAGARRAFDVHREQARRNPAAYGVAAALYIGVLPFVIGGVIWIFLTFFAGVVVAGYYAPSEP
jgi:type IV secretory pathway TraG/TraD family ATPase VirD4